MNSADNIDSEYKEDFEVKSKWFEKVFIEGTQIDYNFMCLL